MPVFGVAVGAFGTLTDAGGGFLLVPMLLALFPDSTPATITSISLAVILLNAGSGTAGYLRQHLIDFRTGAILAVTAIPAAVAGALLTESLSKQQFQITFGITMIVGAFYMLWRGSSPSADASIASPNRTLQDRSGAAYSFNVNEPLAAGISPAAGFISSVLGIGGGIVHVPALIILLRVPPRIATATSQFVLIFTVLAAVLAHIFSGQFQYGWRLAGLIGIGALIGAQLGVRLAGRVNPKIILTLLAVGLIAAGVRQVLAGVF